MHRRAFLLGGVAALASVAAHRATAQTLIENVANVGSGIDRSQQQGTNPGGATVTPAARAHTDWREYLLDRPRELWLRREGAAGKRPSEESKILYWTPQAGYLKDGYVNLCQLFRDTHAERVMSMDPALFDILFGLQAWLAHNGYHQKIIVTSGFRTSATNSHTEGSAFNSRHVTGQAADILVPGINETVLAQGAMLFQKGGVGFYPGRGFTHVDTGPIRTWVGSRRSRG